MNSHSKATIKYNKENTFGFTIRLNRNTDADLIDLFEKIPNRNYFIKSTIRRQIGTAGFWIEHKNAEIDGEHLISNFECSACHDWNKSASDYCPKCGNKKRMIKLSE